MKPVFTAAQMRETEKRYFDTGIPSIMLMEKAAGKLANTLLEQGGKTCVFACGSGGNGGDGYAAARLFAQRGGRAIVLTVSEARNPDTIKNLERVKDCAFAVCGMDAIDTLPRPDMWCDCIFGTGITRQVEGNAERVIRRINSDREAGSLTVACDIPSGLCADTGRIMGICVEADITVTFQTMKMGQLTGKGLEVCGKLCVEDIGIPETLYPSDYSRLITDSDAAGLLPERKRCAHKNNFGHLLIIAGSVGMAGAAVMCAKAALRSGTGLVTVACPKSITDIIQVSAPSAMCVPLPESDGAMNEAAAEVIKQTLVGKTAVAIGPGISRRAVPACVQAVLDSGIRAVIDADALNVISENPELMKKLTRLHAITPHPGEAARLTGQKGLLESEYARMLADTGCAVLVKGAGSVIAGRHVSISTSGCVGMAKGGSGDVLTGITGALLAQGLEPEDALCAASQIHGRAGEKAGKAYGDMAMLPTDIIEYIGSWQ